MTSPFLTAEWRHLLMLNYEIDPLILRPLIPSGTELDFRDGKTYVSMVGFRFLHTRVRGWAIPFHINFEEVNLRFYVRRRATDGWRRGVVFIKEVVPLRAVTAVANWVYNENYVTCRMRTRLREPESDQPGSVEYAWQGPARWNQMSAEFNGDAVIPGQGSEEEFITEHYWGYTRQRDGGTMEYRVTHPQWHVWPTAKVNFVCAVEEFYGPQYADFLGAVPTSAFVADGSAIEVHRGEKL